MKKKIISTVVALLIASIFMFFAVKPGAFNMIGYAIYQTISSYNSPETPGYENAVIYSFDILCALLVFWFVYVITFGIQRRVMKP